MADPFTIAVSVAGLTSLGIQLAQGLKKYADSAIDSKGRILAISIDIELAVQVIKTLDTTLHNPSSQASLTEDSKKLAKDVVSQCRELFREINELLPDIKLVRLKKIDILKWPIIEAKVDLFRSNLEKIKLTLQLLMSVMIYAAMFPSTTDPESIAQQRLEIRRLQEEEARVTARLVAAQLATSRLEALEISTNPGPTAILESRMAVSAASPPPSVERSFGESATGMPMPMRTRYVEPDFHSTPEVSSSRSTIEVPDTMLRPKRKRTYVISGSWGRLIHRVATLFGSPKSRRNVEPEILLEVLKAECDSCLEQLSKLQANVKRTAYTLHRIRIQTDPRWRTDPIYSDRYSASDIIVEDSRPSDSGEHPSSMSRSRATRRRRHRDAYSDEYIALAPNDSVPPGVISTPRSTDRVQHHAIILPSRSASPVLEDDAAKLEPRSISSILDNLPSVDDLVRRWTKIHSDDVNVERGANSSSDLQDVVEQPKTTIK